MFVVSGCNCTEVFEFAEEPLNLVALFVEVGVDGGEPFSRRHQPDIRHGTARGNASFYKWRARYGGMDVEP